MRWFALACAVAACGSSSEPDRLFFPIGFQWGTAIAGFQVDMGCPTLPAADCEDPYSDWYAFVTSPELIADPSVHLSGDPPSAGPGFWELYADDIARAGDLGTNALRLSIEWSRVFPQPTFDAHTREELLALADPAALARYHEILTALHARGMQPLVTLHHYTLPIWIHDGVGCHFDPDGCAAKGWLDPRIVDEIAKYAGFVAGEFQEDVDWWATENEPFAVLLSGYLQPTADRTNPPARAFAFADMKTAFWNMVYAHARMTDAIRENDPQSHVGLVYAMAPVRPCNPDPMDNDTEAAENLFYVYNMVFLNAVAKGQVDRNFDRTVEVDDTLTSRMDWVGINYYTRATVRGTDEASLPELSPLSNFDPLSLRLWEDYPRGIYEMIEVVDRDLGLPAIITENGTQNPDDGDHGPTFMVHHLAWVARALQRGFDVRGYFFWTLMDNYEWNHGVGMRFGLFAVDNDDPQKPRTPRRTAEVYSQIIRQNEVGAELEETWPFPTPPEADEDGCPYWEPTSTSP